jgi:hypothetical protein
MKIEIISKSEFPFTPLLPGWDSKLTRDPCIEKLIAFPLHHGKMRIQFLFKIGSSKSWEKYYLPQQSSNS